MKNFLLILTVLLFVISCREPCKLTEKSVDAAVCKVCFQLSSQAMCTEVAIAVCDICSNNEVEHADCTADLLTLCAAPFLDPTRADVLSACLSDIRKMTCEEASKDMPTSCIELKRLEQ